MRWLGTLCVLVAAMALAGAAWQAWALRSTLVQRQHQLAFIHAAPAERSADALPAGPTLNADDRRRVNLIVRRLNMPWGAIFDALERESSATVTVLAVEPDIERGAIRIHTEGSQLDDLLVSMRSSCTWANCGPRCSRPAWRSRSTARAACAGTCARPRSVFTGSQNAS